MDITSTMVTVSQYTHDIIGNAGRAFLSSRWLGRGDFLHNHRGLTLVEAIVTGVIASVLAGVVITLLNLHTTELDEGTVNVIIQMETENIVDEIVSESRKGHQVLGPDDSWTGNTPALAVDTTDSIRLFDPGGTNYASYRINSATGSLIRSDSTGSRTLAGPGQQVQLTSSSPNRFILSNRRDEVTMDLSLWTTYKNDTLVLRTRRTRFRLRDQP